VVRAALERELAGLPDGVRESSVAALALSLADQLDAQPNPTAHANCSREYRAAMKDLRALQLAGRERDRIDELQAARRRRRAA
jgi:hypothetical protein